MKISQTIAALLATAILCIAFASCDRKLIKDDPSSEEKMTESALTLELVDISATSRLETEEELTSSVNTTMQVQGTTISGTTAVAPTKVMTTVPATTKPVSTTVPSASKPTVPSTTAPSTTAVTTTAPIATTVPTIVPETTTEPPVPERPTDIVTDSEDMDNEQAVISAINRYRAAEGLGELSYSSELSAAADIRAKEIAENFSHLRPDGSLWYTVGTSILAENIAKGHTTAYAVTNAWMNNEGHRKNILTKNYTLTGVGCYYDSATDTYYWVQLFG